LLVNSQSLQKRLTRNSEVWELMRKMNRRRMHAADT